MRAMRNSVFTISACIGMAAAADPLAGSPSDDGDALTIVINEIMYNPADSLGDDDDYQWIELYNTTTTPIDLSGWSLGDVPLTGEIGAHDYAIVARQDLSDPDQDGDFFSAFYNEQHGYQVVETIIDLAGADLGFGGPDFDLVLHDGDGEVADSTGFHPAPGGDGDGSTLERLVAPLDGQDGNFAPSTPPERYGTPEGQNSSSPVVIHVFLPEGPFEPGEVLTIGESVLNRTSQPQVISLWRALEVPRDFVIPIEIPELPEQVTIPPNFELELEAEVEVPDVLPDGRYGYQAAFGRGVQSAGSEWEEFIIRTNDQSPPRQGVHDIVNFCVDSPTDSVPR